MPKRTAGSSTIVLAMTCLCALQGCSRYADPSVAVERITLTDRSAEAAVLDIELAATNTNEVALPLRTVEYTLRLDGDVVFRGTRSAEATLRRVGTQPIVLPAAIRLDRHPAPASGMRYRLTGRMKYVTPGEIAQRLFDAGVRRPTVRFAQEGVLELDG
ncbi:MAG: LEA type 2 family protein [Planctomycetota bacterium]